MCAQLACLDPEECQARSNMNHHQNLVPNPCKDLVAQKRPIILQGPTSRAPGTPQLDEARVCGMPLRPDHTHGPRNANRPGPLTGVPAFRRIQLPKLGTDFLKWPILCVWSRTQSLYRVHLDVECPNQERNALASCESQVLFCELLHPGCPPFRAPRVRRWRMARRSRASKKSQAQLSPEARVFVGMWILLRIAGRLKDHRKE